MWALCKTTSKRSGSRSPTREPARNLTSMTWTTGEPARNLTPSFMVVLVRLEPGKRLDGSPAGELAPLHIGRAVEVLWGGVGGPGGPRPPPRSVPSPPPPKKALSGCTRQCLKARAIRRLRGGATAQQEIPGKSTSPAQSTRQKVHRAQPRSIPACQPCQRPGRRKTCGYRSLSAIVVSSADPGPARGSGRIQGPRNSQAMFWARCKAARPKPRGFREVYGSRIASNGRSRGPEGYGPGGNRLGGGVVEGPPEQPPLVHRR